MHIQCNTLNTSLNARAAFPARHRRVVVCAGMYETREGFFECAARLILGSVLLGSCPEATGAQLDCSCARISMLGFNIAAELVVCTRTHTCVIHKTGIFTEAPGFLEEVLAVAKEVPRLLWGSRGS